MKKETTYRCTVCGNTMAIKYIIIIIILMLPSTAVAEFALGVAQDVVHYDNAYALMARYDHRPTHLSSHAILWNGPDETGGTVTAEYNFWRKIVDLGLGVAYQAKTNKVLGTHWAFSLSGPLDLGEHLRINILHLSNGEAIFRWPRGNPNAGWNFVGLSYRFKES